MSRLSDLLLMDDRSPSQREELRSLLDGVSGASDILGQMVGPLGEINRSRAGYILLGPEGLRTGKGEVTIGREGITLLAVQNTANELKWVTAADGVLIFDFFSFEASAPVGVAGVIRSLSKQAGHEASLLLEASQALGQPRSNIALTTDSAADYLTQFGTPARIVVASDFTVFNEEGLDRDHRFEGDTIPDVLVIDGGLDAAIFNNYARFKEVTAPGTPAAATANLYVKSDGLYYSKDDAGIERLVSGPYRALDVDRSEFSYANSTSETDLYSFTIPGGTLGTDRAVRMYLEMFLFNNSGVTVTVTWRIYYGGSSLASVAGSIATSTAYRYVPFTYLLKGNGATNAQLARSGSIRANTDAIVSTFAIDSTIDKIMKITSQFDTANANVEARVSMRVTEVVADI